MSKINAIVLICQEIWIDSHYLIHICKVPKRTVENGNTNFSQGSSAFWEWIPNQITNNSNWVRVSNIHPRTFIRYPVIMSNIAKFKNIPSLEKLESEKSASYIKFVFENSAIQYWQRYRHEYSDLGFSREKTKEYAITHSVFIEAIELKTNHYKFEYLFQAYQAIQKELNLIFVTNSNNSESLKNKINKCQSHGIKNTLTHGLTRLPGNRQEFDNFWQYRFDCFYRKSKTTSIQNALDSVNDERKIKKEPLFSHETVRQYVRQKKNENIAKLERNGNSYFQNNLLPYLIRHTNNVGDIWMIDGARFPFPVKNSKPGKIFMPWIITIMDVYSRKIIASIIGKNETSEIINLLVHKACFLTGYLPKKIIVDNGSAFTSNENEELIQKCDLLGCEWVFANIEKGREKSYIERSFGTLNTSIYPNMSGFLGQGIKSSRENAHPSPEEIKRIRKEEVRSFHDAEKLCARITVAYNHKNFNEKPSSFEKYKRNISMNLKQKRWSILEKFHIPQLFYKSTEITSAKCMIQLQFNKRFFHYQIPKEHALQYNGVTTEIYFNPSDMETVYSFCMISKKFLFSMQKEVSIEIDKDFWSHNQKRQVGKKVIDKNFILETARNDLENRKQKLIDEGEFIDVETDMRLISHLSSDKDELAQAELHALLKVGEISYDDYEEIGPEKEENAIPKPITIAKTNKIIPF